MSGPVFTALATSTRHLYNLLRSIAITARSDVYITSEGLRFTTEEAHTIQASTLLDKSLFSSYLLQIPDDHPPLAPFQINIHALLETLQIFGVAESASYRNPNGGITSSYAAAFTNPALGLGGTCRISYREQGAPLSITIEESGVKTTCEMNTYEIRNAGYEDNEIPLDRNALVMRIIMPSMWLHDAISELASTNSEVLVVNASSTSKPYLAFEGHGGPFGDSTVDFMPEQKSELAPAGKPRKQPQVTETFSVLAPSGSHGRVKQRYRFDLIKRAGRAMALAQKVSLRMDRQGVLSLQFMVESDDSGAVGGNGALGTLGGEFNFIDFRFVPLVDSDDEDDNEEHYVDEDENDRSRSTSDHD